MHILCVIPARLASSRISHKPLQTIVRQPLIRLVSQRVVALDCFDQVIVATDDEAVRAAVEGIGVEAVLTGTHRNGTERVAEVAAMPEFRNADVVVNVQGDEPFVTRDAVDGAVARIDANTGLGTVATDMQPEDVNAPSAVKVFVDSQSNALGFSRSVSPEPLGTDRVLRHVGVYAYRPDALARWAAADPTAAELEERLEQLRPLGYGARIGVTVLDDSPGHGIDTPEDLRRAELLLTH